jgi:uroporphyrinogen decarboxylase
MYSDPGAWRALMDKVTDVLAAYLKAQVEAGAEALQVFDSWAGCLGPSDYETYVLPYTKKVIDSVGGRVPVINFSTNTGPYIEKVAAAGGDVVGVDWRLDLDGAWQRIGHGRAIQGNLDPGVLFGPAEVIRQRAKEVLDRAGRRPGHIFNLGHGIIPQTPPEHVDRLVKLVRGEV